MLLALGAMWPALSAQAAVKRVRVVDDSFLPAQISIKRGDAVLWRFSRANLNVHNVTVNRAPRGVVRRKFNSGRALAGGSRFRRSFRRAGVYRFYCTLHFGMQMRVNVKRP